MRDALAAVFGRCRLPASTLGKAVGRRLNPSPGWAPPLSARGAEARAPAVFLWEIPACVIYRGRKCFLGRQTVPPGVIFTLRGQGLTTKADVSGTPVVVIHSHDAEGLGSTEQ